MKSKQRRPPLLWAGPAAPRGVLEPALLTLWAHRARPPHLSEAGPGASLGFRVSLGVPSSLAQSLRFPPTVSQETTGGHLCGKCGDKVSGQVLETLISRKPTSRCHMAPHTPVETLQTPGTLPPCEPACNILFSFQVQTPGQERHPDSVYPPDWSPWSPSAARASPTPVRPPCLPPTSFQSPGARRPPRLLDKDPISLQSRE